MHILKWSAFSLDIECIIGECEWVCVVYIAMLSLSVRSQVFFCLFHSNTAEGMYTDLSMRIDTADSIIYSYADCVCLRACAGTRGLIIWYGVFFGCSVYNGKQYILDIFACHNNTV